MFQLLKEPNFDFMGRRNLLLTISLVVVVLCVGVIAVRGVNMGIEFTGGTELQMKFTDQPDIAGIRQALSDAGLDNKSVTTIGDPSEHEVYIRLSGEAEDEEWDYSKQVREAIERRLYPDAPIGQESRDLNIVDDTTLRGVLAGMPELSTDEAASMARAILELRKEISIFHDWEDLSTAEGVTPEVVDFLRANAKIGPIAPRGQSFIGPAIGRELWNKALFAILGSLLGMLCYIWFRFQLKWGFAAVAALAHDTLITLGLFSFFGQELSLPVVAAFLTLVGYSVNDTVVVFDRIRENVKTMRADSFAGLVNKSINQTLSRTIITSGLTWIVVTGLYVFGGAALRPFAFVLTVGVVVGTYSSIYIASPILVLWRHRELRKAEAEAKSGGAGARKAKKVRRTTTG